MSFYLVFVENACIFDAEVNKNSFTETRELVEWQILHFDINVCCGAVLCEKDRIVYFCVYESWQEALMAVIRDKQFGDIAVKQHWRAVRVTVKVRDGRVEAVVPLGVPLDAVVRLVDANRDKLARMLERSPRASLTDGVVVESCWMSVEVRTADVRRVVVARTGCSYVVTRPAGIDDAVTGGAVTACLKHRAHDVLPGMVDSLAQRWGFTYASLRITTSKGRWGSCSNRKSINLSASLMLLPQHLVEFVILHELCHTVHLDHGGAFKRLLDHCCGGRMAECEVELRRHSASVWG